MERLTFIDEVIVHCRGGKGGDGCIHFHREKYRPKGPPDGGDGGDGGNVLFTVDPNLNTLIHLAYQRHFFAEDGERGEKNNSHGKKGKDVVVRVPPGTVLYDDISGEKIGELLREGDMIVVARGGKGGRGNAHFKTPVNRSPLVAEKGKPGEYRRIRVELRLLADVGIAGKPNAGKSTLLSVISNARPRIAPYPFTTITPQVGTVVLPGYRSFVAVEVPGLIEGAHLGKGLGLSFLRHLLRVSIILILVSGEVVETRNCSGKKEAIDTIVDEVEMIKKEMFAFDPEMQKKLLLVGVSKWDIVGVPWKDELEKALIERNFLVFSSATRYGIDKLKETLFHFVMEAKRGAQEKEV